jgi:hypothetical protein
MSKFDELNSWLKDHIFEYTEIQEFLLFHKISKHCKTSFDKLYGTLFKSCYDYLKIMLGDKEIPVLVKFFDNELLQNLACQLQSKHSITNIQKVIAIIIYRLILKYKLKNIKINETFSEFTINILSNLLSFDNKLDTLEIYIKTPKEKYLFQNSDKFWSSLKNKIIPIIQINFFDSILIFDKKAKSLLL